MAYLTEAIDVGGFRLALERPEDAEALIDEDAFADDEFLPYWAERWPAGIALAEHVAREGPCVESTQSWNRAPVRVLELGRVYGGTPPITIPLIQDDLAALAGTSRATVNRVLRDAERRGLVELGRGRTILRDPEGMTRLARLPAQSESPAA